MLDKCFDLKQMSHSGISVQTNSLNKIISIKMLNICRCDPTGKFDVNSKLFNSHTTVTEIFDEFVCQNVPELETHIRVKRVSVP